MCCPTDERDLFWTAPCNIKIEELVDSSRKTGKQGDPDNAAARHGSPALPPRSSIESNPTRPLVRPRSGRAECSRAVVVVLTIEQRSTTVPAHACRHRRRLAARHGLTIVRQIDDVAGRRYVFFNHGCSSRLTRCLSQTSFAQTFSPPLKFYRRNCGTPPRSPHRLNPDLFCDTTHHVSASGVRSR